MLFIHTAELLWLAGMCPFVSITAMWLCVLYVLVHNNKCVEQTVLVQTYTKDNAAKNSCSGGIRGQGFRI